jgi:hypothetical protein
VGPFSFSASREFELSSPKGCVRTEEQSDDRPKAHLSGAAIAHPCASRHSCILHIARQ